ncbi:hypothetical protein ACIBKY_03630 [Nonomuraea sp. NPDC050394]
MLADQPTLADLLAANVERLEIAYGDRQPAAEEHLVPSRDRP